MIKLKDFTPEKDQILQDEKFRVLCKKFNVSHLNLERAKDKKRFQDRMFFRLDDVPVTKRTFSKLFKENSIWFAMNCEVIHDKVIAVPLGITDTSWCSLIGDLDIILEKHKSERKNRNLAYFNCNCDRRDGGLKERLEVKEKFKNKEWMTNGKFQRDKTGHANFVDEIYNHKFVFCPRGNGVDTHRLWMSLYLGTIPVVKDHITHHAFKHLPILFINDWSEVTEEFLNKKFEEIHSKEYDFSILGMDYWVKLFESHFQKS